MEKRFFGFIVGVLLVVLSFGVAVGGVQSEYRIITESPVKVIRYDTSGDTYDATVVRTQGGAICPGVSVFCMWTEPQCGTLSYSFDRAVTNQNGVASFCIPGPTGGSTFRYLTLWVEGDSTACLDKCGGVYSDGRASVIHRMIWYANTDLPAQVKLVHPEGDICICPCSDLILIYKVVNGWGTPMEGVEVVPVLGTELISTCPLSQTTDVNGEVVFHLFTGCQEKDYLFQVKLGGVWGYIQSSPTSIRIGNECGKSTPTTATAIKAVNPSYWEGGTPVWKSPIGGGSIPMTFLVTNKNGQPVVGEEVLVAYPNGEHVTDSSGRITISSPSGDGRSPGDWDGSQVWVSADPNIALDFKIVYY